MAIQRKLGRKNPYELMMALKAEDEPRAGVESSARPAVTYRPESSKAVITRKLKAKHHISGTQ